MSQNEKIKVLFTVFKVKLCKKMIMYLKNEIEWIKRSPKGDKIFHSHMEN
jgi:hypothetical protein